MKKEQFEEEQQDMIGNLHNVIVAGLQQYKPKPEFAVFVLEMIKQEILEEVSRRKFNGS